MPSLGGGWGQLHLVLGWAWGMTGDSPLRPLLYCEPTEAWVKVLGSGKRCQGPLGRLTTCHRNKNSFERDSQALRLALILRRLCSWLAVAFIGQKPRTCTQSLLLQKGLSFPLWLHLVNVQADMWGRGIPLDDFLVHSQQEDQLFVGGLGITNST